MGQRSNPHPKLPCLDNRDTGCWVHYFLFKPLICAVLSGVSRTVKIPYMKDLLKMGVLESLD